MAYSPPAIDKLGGVSRVADGLGLGRSTVWYWKRTGMIPRRRWTAVIELGRQLGVTITRDDMLPDPEMHEGNAA